MGTKAAITGRATRHSPTFRADGVTRNDPRNLAVYRQIKTVSAIKRSILRFFRFFVA
jgi:hypothetical protein